MASRISRFHPHLMPLESVTNLLKEKVEQYRQVTYRIKVITERSQVKHKPFFHIPIECICEVRLVVNLFCNTIKIPIYHDFYVHEGIDFSFIFYVHKYTLKKEEAML